MLLLTSYIYSVVQSHSIMRAGFEPAYPNYYCSNQLNYLVRKREWESNPRPIVVDGFLENHPKPPNQVEQYNIIRHCEKSTTIVLYRNTQQDLFDII